MQTFMNEDFLLNTGSAKTLYHDYAKDMPIIDYHCHVNPMEIATDARFENITQAWLGGDHYKWRLMRANGTDEKFITGKESTDYEKFLAFAKAISKAVGNPVYHWAHLELKRYFDCDLILSEQTASEIWDVCNKKLAQPEFSIRGIIKRSNVRVIATTDDPADSLQWHKEIAQDRSFDVKVVPSFRPDKAVRIEKPEFLGYIKTLATADGSSINSFEQLLATLSRRIDFFHQMGCRASDHGLDYIPFVADTKNEAAQIFQNVLSGKTISGEQVEIYQTAIMLFLGREYAKHGWVMQLHYGAIRNTNAKMFGVLGADTGFDAVSTRVCSDDISQFLNALEETDQLPKTVLYSLNESDNAMLAVLAGCFQGSGVVCKVQHGSAWWFNDTKSGIKNQLIHLAESSLLGGFIGMLTDSRSFLSYTRHEYFRRILCSLIGEWVENGELPWDSKALGEMVQDICYNNAANYFDFDGIKKIL